MSNLLAELQTIGDDHDCDAAYDAIREIVRLRLAVSDSAERIRDLEAALEQLKERLSAARVKYEQPMMLKALELQKRVDELEAALSSIIERSHGFDLPTYDLALKALYGQGFPWSKFAVGVKSHE